MSKQETRTPAEQKHYIAGRRKGFIWGVGLTTVLSIIIVFCPELLIVLVILLVVSMIG